MRDVPEGVQVIRRPIWEPYSLYKKFVGARKDEKINTGFLSERRRPGFAQQISVWLRGNLFIPDARCFWINPSVRFLNEWLSENPVDAIVSSGPPHSMHLIAKNVASQNHIPWVADFRDPWTNIDYYKQLKLTAWADKKHHRLEREVVTKADKVVVVGNDMRTEFKSNYGIDSIVITNGYDEDDFKVDGVPVNDGFLVSHVGTLVPSRNPESLWKALGSLVKDNSAFASALRLRLIGKVDISIKHSILQAGLENHVQYIDYLPHADVPVQLKSANMLLLILNDTPNAKGILTGKMFEYLASGNRILCIGPVDGDAARILAETGSGSTCDFNDVDGIRTAVLNNFTGNRMGEMSGAVGSREKYSRKSLTRDLVEVLNSIV